MVGPMAPLPSPAPARLSVARRLNDEWRRLATSPAFCAHLRRWPAELARYEDGDQLLVATGRDGGLPTADADHLLAVLIELARHDELAARVVLQRVIPGLINAAVRRTSGRPGQRQQLFDDLVASAWLVIRRFPIERRPAKIAVNVLRDAEYVTCVRPHRLRSAGELPDDFAGAERRLAPTGLDGRPLDHRPPATELARVFRLGAASGVCRRDLAMLAAASLEGWLAAEVAAHFDVTTRTVRNRRARTTAALAAVVRAAA
jgi:DNA-directed RNA polymerase specialized sigma24 family protein